MGVLTFTSSQLPAIFVAVICVVVRRPRRLELVELVAPVVKPLEVVALVIVPGVVDVHAPRAEALRDVLRVRVRVEIVSEREQALLRQRPRVLRVAEEFLLLRRALLGLLLRRVLEQAHAAALPPAEPRAKTVELQGTLGLVRGTAAEPLKTRAKREQEASESERKVSEKSAKAHHDRALHVRQRELRVRRRGGWG